MTSNKVLAGSACAATIAVLALWQQAPPPTPTPTPADTRPPAVDNAPLPEEQAEIMRAQTERAAAPSMTTALGRLAAPVDRCLGVTTGPCAFPRVDLSGVTVATPITVRSSDGQGGDLAYGGGAVGVSEDGARLYVSCGPPRRGVATLALPANGGPATWAQACSGPDEAAIKQIIPGWGAGEPRLGGVTEADGVVTVSAYGTYDANGVAQASHWAGPSLTALSGPFRGTVAPGLVKGNMGVVPPEWRQYLGGPLFATAGYTSIISRASYGTAFSTFDPKTVTAHGFAMSMLLGCPHSVLACRTWTAWGPSTNGFEGAEQDGGAFIVPGTRTLVAIEREATGALPGPGVAGAAVPHDCYGYRTDTLALHGAPYTVNPAEGVRWCWSPADPFAQKGNKGGTYRLVAKLYDLADLVAVRQGLEQPWNVKQYATVDLPGSSASEYVSGGAYNPKTDEFYVVRFLGGATSTIYRLTGFRAAAPPPPPVDCAGDWSPWARVPGSETACTNGQRTFTEERTFTVTTAPANGGQACPASPETRTAAEVCISLLDCTASGVGSAATDIAVTVVCNGQGLQEIRQTFTLKRQ